MLEAMISEVLLRHLDRVCVRVRAKWGNLSAIKGIEEIKTRLPIIVGKMVVSGLDASGDAAWIKEYGSGSLLDMSNPFLAEYKSSNRWNKEREFEGNEFIARREGAAVMRPDGTSYVSSGKAYRRVHKMNSATYRNDGQSGQYGLHLERPLNRGASNPGYKAFKPMHIIRNELIFEMPLIIEDLRLALAEYTRQQIKEAWES